MGFVRRYSQASSSSNQQATTTPLEYFSLVVKGRKDKPEILTEELRKLVESKTQVGRWKRPWISGPGESRSALVLLASKDMAKCLESRDFMSTFLEALGPPGEPQGSATVDVLTGLTDGLQPETLGARPRSGLSVLYGPQSILPRLWEQDDTASAGAPNTDRAASVSVAPACPGQPFHSHVTIPMANTIFQNGRRSTLFATRYERAARGGRFEATLTLDKTAQAIEVTTEAGPRFAPRLPLVPLAPPREIAAGLGNIVRQVVVGGRPAPASRELEDLIPRLLEARGRRDTVGVWAVVVPPHVIREHDAFKNIRPFSECLDGSLSEKDLVKLNWECLSQVGTHGLRVHKILSGGGGWGAKQGLLSLDPETSYDAPEQEDIDDFIKAFEARFRSKDESSAAAAEASAGEEDSSAVAPGSYLLFCAQAELESGGLNVEIGGEGGRGWNFGVAELHDGEDGRTAKSEEGEGAGVSTLPEVFTAMSAEGVYLRLGAPGQAKEHAAIRFFPFTTKIDVPHAFLCN
ncbi:hypothetical protein KJ359_007871 [Pestalotiopsis sp. 9143b]|nr:hypothetical protein KJ359_007871 [Pestalotiopsis sp. 9143b]